MRLRTGTVTLASLLLLASLTACNEDPSDADPDISSDTSQPTSSQSSADPSPTDTGPSIPPEAQGTNEASAKAFVKFYFETLSEAMRTGDPDTVRQLSTKRCKTCQSVAGRIRNVYDKDGELDTDGWNVAKFVPYLSKAKKQGFYLTVDEAESRLFDADGSLVTETPKAETTSRVVLVRTSGGWRMSDWAFIE